MTKKRRRKRTRPGARAELPAEGNGAPSEDLPQPERAERAPAESVQISRRRRPGVPSPYPPLLESVGRGVRATAQLPVVIAVFLATLLTWGAFVLMGVPVGPQVLVSMLAIPPTTLMEIDIPILFAVGGESIGGVIGVLVGLGLLRSLTLAVPIMLVNTALRGTNGERSVIEALPRVVLAVFGIYVLEFALGTVVQGFLASFLGQLVSILGVVGLYFLAMVPVVAAVERVPSREALVMGFRAARQPGTRHLALIFAYWALLQVLTLVTVGLTGGVFAPATPTISMWVLTLLSSFLQYTILAALCYRWLAVRELVPRPERRVRAR